MILCIYCVWLVYYLYIPCFDGVILCFSSKVVLWSCTPTSSPPKCAATKAKLRFFYFSILFVFILIVYLCVSIFVVFYKYICVLAVNFSFQLKGRLVVVYVNIKHTKTRGNKSQATVLPF